MKTVIYLDVLLLVNFLMGYFLLRASGLLTGAALAYPRLLAGAAAASCASLVLLAPPLPLGVQLAYQLGTALCINRCAFAWRGWRSLIQQALWYALLNLLAAGVVLLAVQYGGLSGMQTNNLAVYFNVSPLTLLLAVLTVYWCIRLGLLLFGPPPAERPWQMELHLPGTVLRVQGHLDTGFFLTDAFTGAPVVVLGWPAVRGRLSGPLDAFLTEYFTAGGAVLPPPGLPVRFVPCQGLGEAQVLPGLAAGPVTVQQGSARHTVPAVTVAFSPQDIRAGGSAALFGRDLLTKSTKYKKEGCTQC